MPFQVTHTPISAALRLGAESGRGLARQRNWQARVQQESQAQSLRRLMQAEQAQQVQQALAAEEARQRRRREQEQARRQQYQLGLEAQREQRLRQGQEQLQEYRQAQIEQDLMAEQRRQQQLQAKEAAREQAAEKQQQQEARLLASAVDSRTRKKLTTLEDIHEANVQKLQQMADPFSTEWGSRSQWQPAPAVTPSEWAIQRQVVANSEAMLNRARQDAAVQFGLPLFQPRQVDPEAAQQMQALIAQQYGVAQPDPQTGEPGVEAPQRMSKPEITPKLRSSIQRAVQQGLTPQQFLQQMQAPQGLNATQLRELGNKIMGEFQRIRQTNVIGAIGQVPVVGQMLGQKMTQQAPTGLAMR